MKSNAVILTLLLTTVIWASAGTLLGADWPQYRNDAARRAASTAGLSKTLHLLWERQLPSPRPVFPGQNQICYDRTYEPVVMGKLMFLPSMVNDSVTALDTKTGAQVWQYFAEGPVRLAPVAWQDKVYFVSDDGYLYCLDAATGRFRWKYRGLPHGRADRKLMGDGRLISATPARGGPVLHDGIIYFGAGIWADDGVFVHAVDATTGETVWSNSTSGHIDRANPDHGVGGIAGISPQGHMAILNDTLVIPCGAQLPALMDLKTGKLHTYTMGWGGKYQQPKGCVYVSGVGKYLMHGGDLYDISDVSKQPSLNNVDVEYDKTRMIHIGGLPRLQVDHTNLKKQPLGDFRNPAFTAQAMYYHQDDIVALDLTKPTVRANEPGKRFEDLESVIFPELWRLRSDSKVHIKAGERLYCSSPGTVEAVDIPQSDDEEPRVSWQGNVEGMPHRILAADDKLFVVTLEGRIYAFGPDKPTQAVVHHAATTPKSLSPDKRAAQVLAATEVTNGYVLILGAEQSQFVKTVVEQTNCDVIAIQEDAVKASQLRKEFQEEGLYGTRVSLLAGKPDSLALPPYLANLIVDTNPDHARDVTNVPMLFECLRPHGGVLCMSTTSAEHELIEKLVSQGRLPDASLVRRGVYSLLTRSGPLAATSDWSHSNANAASTGASTDQVVKPPLKRLWFDGTHRWHKSRGMTEVRIAGGRMLVGGEKLYALDAYTGRHLWSIDVQARGEKLIAMEDAIYLADGGSCWVLDPTTGKRLKQLKFPGAGRANWSFMRATEEILIASNEDVIACINRKTGLELWQHQCDNSIQSIAVGDGKVVCCDAVNRRRNAVKPGDPGGAMTAIDVSNGKVLWKVATTGEVQYSSAHDMIVVGRQLPKEGIEIPMFNSVYPLKEFSAYKASDGELLWSGIQATHIYIVGDKLLSYVTQQIPKHAHVSMHEPLTGKKVGKELKWWQRGCTVLRAGPSLLTTRFQGNAAFCDLSDGSFTPITHVRAACSNNLFPANGLLIAPNLSEGCACNYIPISQGFVPAAVE